MLEELPKLSERARQVATELGHRLTPIHFNGDRAWAECRRKGCGMGLSLSQAPGEPAMVGSAVTFPCPVRRGP